jgi:hypothetical protein
MSNPKATVPETEPPTLEQQPKTKSEVLSGESRNELKVTWIQVIGGIVAAVIIAIGSYLTGVGAQPNSAQPGPSVPPAEATEVPVLPQRPPANIYTVFKDISIFDLRSWRPMQDTSRRKDGRISPVNYTNYLHVKKLVEVDTFTAHYATSGSAIDLRCITHKDTVFVDKNSVHHKGAIEYAVQVDISEVPVNEEFLIVIEGTYWNGFRDIQSETASTYTDLQTAGLKELGLVVFLPTDKPFESTEIYRQVGKNPTELVTHDIGTLYRDESKLFVYWNVGNIKPDTHYTIKWDW